MKLIQLNTWGGRLENQINGFFEEEKADIVCLQEVMSVGAGSVGLFTSLEHIQQTNHYKHAFISPVFSFNLMHRTAHFGNAIVTSYDLADKTTIFTNLEHKDNFDFNEDDYNVRNLQHAVLSIGGNKLNILNHHGHHVPTHKNGNPETFRQMKQLAAYIETLTGPIILCGDFNLEPNSDSLNLINDRLENLPVKYKLSTTRTNLTNKKEVCDYIFVNNQVKIKEFFASDKIVSDHQALILDFEL